MLIYSTDELLNYVSALERTIQAAATSELGFTLDDSILNGTGVGQPLGVLNAPSLVTVTKETGQGSGTILYENITKMWMRLLPRSQAAAVWLINPSAMQQLYQMNAAVGTSGVPVYLPASQSASNEPYSTLFGRPVVPCERCQALGTAGDIILGDFRNGYALAEKGGIDYAMSMHVRFIYDESVFRFVMRVDGQPVLGSAITPYKGGSSNSLGHFVVLQSR